MPPQNYFSINFLDVGQGDGNFVVCPGGQSILIDLGSIKNSKVAGGDAVKYLETQLEKLRKERGLAHPTIDLLLVTHPDPDHFNLIPKLMDRLPNLDILEMCFGGDESDYQKTFRKKVMKPLDTKKKLFDFTDEDHDLPTRARWTFSNGDVQLFLLSANVPDKKSNDYNAQSLVTMFIYKEESIIMTGDAEGTTEKKILGWYSKTFLNSLALKLGHHGAKAGTTEDWLEAVQPKSIFVSSDQKWAHPYCETIQRVIDEKSLYNDADHHAWLCGQGSKANKQYVNHYDQQWIYTTLAFQRTEKPSKDQKKLIAEIVATYDPTGALPLGGVQGVQYELRILPNGKVSVDRTE